jgi:hypothetical protein
MNERTPDQAVTRPVTRDQLRLIGDLLGCLDAAGYDFADTQRLQLLMTASMSPQAGEALLDSLDIAALISRSSLGDPTARWIRSQTSAAQIAEILRRRDQAPATGQPPARLAGTAIPGSPGTAALLAEDERPDAMTRPGPRRRWRFQASAARNHLIALAGATGKVVGRVPAVTAAVIVVIATLAFIAARQHSGTSPDPMKWPTLAPRPVPSSSPAGPAQPRIMGTSTYQQGRMVYFEIFYEDSGHDAAGFSFVGVDESDMPRQVLSFSSAAGAIVEQGLVAYPLNQGCGTDREHTSTIKAWIYDSAGVRSQPVVIHLACTA